MTRKEVNRLGLFGATSYIVGSVIGSGIFVSPKGILEHAGSVGLSLIIWVAAAVLASLTAINYIELGTSIPESGAEFAYVSYVGWYPIAFSFLWLATLIQCSCTGATLALTFGEYIMVAVDPLVCMSETDRKYAVLLLSYGLLLLTSLLNMFSLNRVAARIQMASMVAKIAALIMIIVIGLYFMIFKGYTQHFSKDYAFKGSDWSPAQIVLALYQGNWAYGGYTILNYGMEDIQIKNFKRTVPLAVIFGLFMSAGVYVLANVAYFAVLTPQEILNSSAVATTFAQETVGSFSYAMPALIAVLMLGSSNAEVFAWSRYIQAGARRGMMPTMLSLIHPDNDSPRPAVFFHTVLSMAFCLIGDIYTLVNYLTVTALLSTMFSVGALAYIKWKKIPVSTTAVKFHIIWPILNFLINAALIVIPVIVEPVKSAVGFGLFILGIVSYFVFIRPTKRMRFLMKLDVHSLP
ncbi:hypothetical protein Y032_0285g1347 [Ancylostoma ceylanicum]|uniref:Amino acid permease n=1 Tax=Ancylostoma ceylanicum TaxID=53326 RepID=A0A016S632_9BILA|nr:hypothetical protein Y032_0285g1347 [Ancylostoma ceylanicum]